LKVEVGDDTEAVDLVGEQSGEREHEEEDESWRDVFPEPRSPCLLVKCS
jgi:hypothetical protein